MKIKEQSDIRRKLKFLNYGKKRQGSFQRPAGILVFPGKSIIKRKRGYEEYGETALINSKPCPENPKIRLAAEIG